MYIYDAFRYPRLWSQFFTTDGLFCIILLVIQIVALICAVIKRNPYVWIFLYTMESAEFLIAFRLNMEGGQQGEIAHIAMWLYFVMIWITVITHLVQAKKQWAAIYVLESAIILSSIPGLYSAKFFAVCMVIAFTVLLIGTICIHRNLKRNK